MQKNLSSKKCLWLLSFVVINICTLHAQEWHDDILFFNKTGTDNKVYQNNFIVKAGADGCLYERNMVMYSFTVDGESAPFVSANKRVVPDNPINIMISNAINAYTGFAVGNRTYASQETSIYSLIDPVIAFAKIEPLTSLNPIVIIGGIFDPNITIGENWSDLTEENKTLVNGSTVQDLLDLVGGASAYDKPAFTETNDVGSISLTHMDPTSSLVTDNVYYITKANTDGCSGYHRKKFLVTLDPGTNYFKDNDQDGYGDNSETIQALEQPNGYVQVGGDCNDNDENINPGATEIYDQIDNNCDGTIDEGFAPYYKDMDSDSYGDMNDTQPEYYTEATVPVNKSLNNTDCDDTKATVYAGAQEIPNNGVDENCDGLGASTNVYRTHATCTTGGKLRITTDLPNGTTLTLLTNGVNVASGDITEGEFTFDNLAAGAYILEGLELPVNLNIDNIDNP